MKQLLNTLYVVSQGAYIGKESETVVVRVDREVRLQLPILALGSIVCFGQVSCSPALMHFCAERGVAISFLSEHGRFLAKVVGPVHGNVLLRRQQYRRADDDSGTKAIAVPIIAAKVMNGRTSILRALRDRPDAAGAEELKRASDSCLRSSRSFPAAILSTPPAASRAPRRAPISASWKR